MESLPRDATLLAYRAIDLLAMLLILTLVEICEELFALRFQSVRFLGDSDLKYRFILVEWIFCSESCDVWCLRHTGNSSILSLN